ncbi:hypothetical protein BGP_5099 [Beggiatoa sp. PS]|nr:hypothetical protein BGP_5099 [Beggiatoa sp. PS]
MQLPLEVCREFGQFAYQDKQEGVEAIAAIQGFMEEYQALIFYQCVIVVEFESISPNCHRW